MITAEQIMDLLGVSKASAYRIISELNEILKKKGFLTVKGRTSKKLFNEKFYLEEQGGNCNACIQG